MSDRYITSIGGYPYLNLAVPFQKPFVRNRALQAIGTAIDIEFKNVCL